MDGPREASLRILKKHPFSEAFTSEDWETCSRQKCAPPRGFYELAMFINTTRQPDVLPEMPCFSGETSHTRQCG